MKKEKVKQCLAALEGISYLDWMRIRMEVDRAFENMKTDAQADFEFWSGEEAYRNIERRYG